MYDQDDFDIELAEKETEIARVVREVTVRGMSQLTYDEAELIHRGIFNNIDRRRLTAMPSNTQRQIALEAIYAQYPEFRQLALEGFDWKTIGAVVGSVGVGAIVFKLVSWIIEKLSGGYGGAPKDIGAIVNKHHVDGIGIREHFLQAFDEVEKEARLKRTNPKTDDVELNTAVSEYLFDETDFDKNVLMQALVRDNPSINAKNFKREFEAIVNSPIFKKYPEMAAVLASKYPVRGGVLMGALYGFNLSEMVREARSILNDIGDCLVTADNILKISSGEVVGRKVGELGRKVDELTRRVEKTRGFKGTRQYEEFRTVMRNRYSYRAGDGLIAPDSRLGEIDLKSLGTLHSDLDSIVKRLKTIRPKHNLRNEAWLNSQYKHQEDNFKKQMRALSKVVNTVLPAMLAIGKYSDDCRALMDDIRKVRHYVIYSSSS